MVILIPAQAAFAALTWHGVWMLNHGQVAPLIEAAGLAFAATVLLVLWFGRIAAHRGRSPAWGLVGLFSLLGVAAIICLPRRPAVRGFPVMVNEQDR